MDISTLAQKAATKVNRHTPMALTVIAALGVFATAYTAHRAGVKATQKITVSEIERGEMITDPKEKLRLVWTYYVAPLSIGMATVACIASGQAMNMRRQAAIMGAYALGERAFNSYKEKMIEQLGEEQEGEIRKSVTVDRALDIIAENPSMIEEIDEEHEKMLAQGFENKAMFIDTYSGQMFISDLESIYRGMSAVNFRCAEDGYASMNYFYAVIGGRSTELGEQVGWNTDHMMDLIITEVHREEKDVLKVYGIDYMESPMMEYRKVWK